LHLFDAPTPTGSIEQQHAAVMSHLDIIKTPGRLREAFGRLPIDGIVIARRQLDMALRVEEAILSSPHPYLVLAHTRTEFSAALLAMSDTLENESTDRPPVWFMLITRQIRAVSLSPPEPEIVRRNQWQHLLADD